MSDFASYNKSKEASLAGMFSKQFVSEKTIAEQKKESNGQDELPYDPRPLHEKLREQKMIAEEEYKEQMRFANQIRGLDPDEADFLDEQARLEKQRLESIKAQERDELEQFRKLASKAAVEATAPIMKPKNESSLNNQNKPKIPPKDKQRSILGLVVKRKASASSSNEGSSSTNSVDNAEIRNTKKIKAEDTPRGNVKSIGKKNVNLVASLVGAYDSDSSDEAGSS